MASGSCFDPMYKSLGRMLGNLGVAVMLVDFRAPCPSFAST